MIKTVQYNDFTSLSYDVKRNFELLKEEIKEFVNNGGNILLPVLDRDTSSFFEWFHTIFKDKSEEYLLKLIEEKIIENPFDFTVDEETKSIFFSNKIPFHWLRNFCSEYPTLISQSLENLLIKIDNWDLGLDYFLFSYDTLEKRAYLTKDIEDDTTQYPKLVRIENDNKTIEQTYHPLISILKHFNYSNSNQHLFYDAIFSSKTKTDFKKLWTHNPNFLNQTLDNSYKGIEKLAFIFYKHDMGRDYLHNNKKTLIDMIQYSIFNQNVEFLKEHISKWNISEVESDLGVYEYLLNYTNDPEIIDLFLKNGASYHDNKNDKHTIPSIFQYATSPNLIDGILTYDKNVSEYVSKNPEELYKVLFLPNNKNRSFQQKTLKLLVEKHNYFLDNEEYVHLFQNFGNLEDFKWLINNGVDVRKCARFIEQTLSHKKDGLKYLKQLQKENLFNSFYPDPLFHILDKYKNKDFSTWLDKCPNENYSRYTLDGYPAWWGVNSSNMWDIVKNKVTDFSQLSKTGLSWHYHIVVRNTKSDYKEITDLDIFKQMLKKQPNLMFDLSGVDSESKNVFHHLFKTKYSYNHHPDLLLNVLEHSNSNILSLLLQEDKNGITPLGELYESLSSNNRETYNINKYFNILINHCANQEPNAKIINTIENNPLFDFNQKLKLPNINVENKEVTEREITLADLFIKILNDEESTKVINYLKLQQSIIPSEKKNNRIKI